MPALPARLAPPGPLFSYPLQEYLLQGTPWVQDKALPAPSFPVSLGIIESSPILRPHWQKACFNTFTLKSPTEFEVQDVMVFCLYS